MVHECKLCNKKFNSEDALRMHNKSKHYEIKKNPIDSKNMKMIIIGSVIILILGVSSILVTNYMNNSPKLYVNTTNYNFGTVSQSGDGIVSTLVLLRNDGSKDLIIKDISTSCGCTSAALIRNGVEGNAYSMNHGNGPGGVGSDRMNEVISPGESAYLKIYYNPSTHSDLRGPVSRYVSIKTNALTSIEKIWINVNQVA